MQFVLNCKVCAVTFVQQKMNQYKQEPICSKSYIKQPFPWPLIRLGHQSCSGKISGNDGSLLSVNFVEGQRNWKGSRFLPSVHQRRRRKSEYYGVPSKPSKKSFRISTVLFIPAITMLLLKLSLLVPSIGLGLLNPQRDLVRLVWCSYRNPFNDK